jgi:hypothetical protein
MFSRSGIPYGVAVTVTPYGKHVAIDSTSTLNYMVVVPDYFCH